MSRSVDRSGGFTLLEIMVALVVLGLLVVGLAQGVRYGLRAWQAQVKLITGDEDLAAVDRTLRGLIGSMNPGNGMNPAPITATADRLTCITALPDGVAASVGSRWVTATLQVDPAHRLVLQWQRYIHADWLRAPPLETSVLLPGVARLTLAYWQPAGGWAGSWRYPNLPALIRIHVTFPPGDPRHWPDIVAAPRLDRP